MSQLMLLSEAKRTVSVPGLHPPVPMTAGATITATGINLCLKAANMSFEFVNMGTPHKLFDFVQSGARVVIQ